MSNPFDYKTKTPGYSPTPNDTMRDFMQKEVCTRSKLELQKAKVTGYTAAF